MQGGVCGSVDSGLMQLCSCNSLPSDTLESVLLLGVDSSHEDDDDDDDDEEEEKEEKEEEEEG